MQKIANQHHLDRERELRRRARRRYAQSEKGKACQRRADLRYRARHPERIKARTAVETAIDAGRLPRASIVKCAHCPDLAEHYHHFNGYDNPLDVEPVCHDCHEDIHFEERSNNASRD